MHVQKQHSYHIWIKFGKMVRIPDIITCADFGDDG